MKHYLRWMYCVCLAAALWHMVGTESRAQEFGTTQILLGGNLYAYEYNDGSFDYYDGDIMVGPGGYVYTDSGGFGSIYDSSGWSNGAFGIAADNHTMVGTPPGIVVIDPSYGDSVNNGFASSTNGFPTFWNGYGYVTKYFFSGGYSSTFFQVGSSPWYAVAANGSDYLIDGTSGWPATNIGFGPPPQTVYIDGNAYGLMATGYTVSADTYTESSYYTFGSGGPSCNIQRNSYAGDLSAYPATGSIWTDSFIATLNPFTLAIGTGVAANTSVSFSSPAGTPTIGPPYISWNGNLLSFVYTANDGTDVYWCGVGTVYDYTVYIHPNNSVETAGDSNDFDGTYNRAAKTFDFGQSAAISLFGLDANGNPIGLPPGVTLLFGTSEVGNWVLLPDGEHQADYTYTRPDGSCGVKFVNLPASQPFLVAYNQGDYNSQLYQTQNGDMVLNAVNGWPVSNVFPTQLYVNGVACPLHWSGNAVGGADQDIYGSAPYVSADNSTTVTLNWGWDWGNPVWTWSMPSQGGQWNGGNNFVNVPSGTFISLTPPPANPSYGPASLAWNGMALGFVGWKSQMMGLDVYEGGGTRMTIDGAGNANIIDITSETTLFTGTYNSATYAFDFGAVNYGNVSAKDSLGNLLYASTPVPENGLQLWLSADYGVTLEVVNTQQTSSIQSWTDQGGHNNNALAALGGGWLAPTLAPNAINGHCAVTFSGNSLLAIPTLTGWNAAGEVFVVIASAGATYNNSALWSFGSSDWTAYYYGDGSIRDGFGNTAQHNEGRPNQDMTQFHIYQASSKTGLWQSWIDGITNYVTTNNTVGFATTPLLGTNAVTGPGGGFTGAIAEILVYDHTLSDAERLHALTYLSTRYHLAPQATAPTNVTVKGINSTTGLVSWLAPIDGARTTYNVQRQENGGAWTLISTNSAAQSLVDSGLNPASNYIYEVQTLSTRGPSSWVESGVLNLSTTPAGVFPRAGMVEWLMADGAVQSPIQYLPDYSGAGNDAWQGNYVERPPLVANAVNGKPAFGFSGVVNTPQQITMPNIFNNATAAHAFVVVKSTGINSGLWNLGNGGSWTWYPYSNGLIYDNVGCTGQYTFAPAQDLTQFHIYEVCAQTNLWQNWINGVSQLRKTSNTLQFPSVPALGANSGNSGFIGQIAELVVFNRPLSTVERQGMLTYLNQKYALIPAPAVPANVAAVQLNSGQNLVTWNWTENNNEVSYVIERKTGTGGTYATLATVQAAGSYIDTTIVASQQYYYRVYATNLTGQSGYSDETGVATPMMEGGTMPLSGLALWLMADGAWESPVGYLLDYSGNGNDAQQPAAIPRPTILPNAVNGKPALHFVGNREPAWWNNQTLLLPDVLHAATATAAEAVIVLRASAVMGNSSALWNFGTTNNSYYADGNGNVADNFGTTTQMNEGTPSQDITKFHVYEVCSQPGLWQSWIDGIPLCQSTNNATPSFTASPTIGTNLAINGFSGDIAEVVVYNRPLSAVERTGILAYLTQKYALVAAPVTPTGLSAVALNPGSAMVTWNEPVTNSSTYFSLWRQQGASAPVLLTTLQGVKTYIDNSVSSGNTYTYQVQAYNSFGASDLCPAATLQWNMPSVSSLPTNGMQLWIMGDGAVETPVAYLPDYSGNDFDAWQMSLQNRPVLMQNALNGKPVMHFAGAEVTQTLNFPNFLPSATAAEALVVLRADLRTVNNSGLWNFGNQGNYSWYAASNGVVYEVFGSNRQFNEGNPSQDITQFHLYDMASQAGSWQSWIDGTQLINATSNTFYFPTNPVLGCNPGGSGFSGDIAEMVVYNRTLTTAERQAWRQYFAIKYFLSNFDPDGDGLTTGQELQLGLNPLNAYTYGGTVNDSNALTLGLLPLYPTALYPNPNGPPPANPPPAASGTMTIQLTAPAGAVLH